MKIKGIFLPAGEETQKSETIAIPVPERVSVPLYGCKPEIKVEQRVLLGQKIGEPADNDSVPVYSSVSGRVKEIKEITLPDGTVCQAAVIASDGRQEISQWVKPPTVHSGSEFINAMRNSGCVGLSGKGDPTFKRLECFGKKIDTLIINAAECEPYITADERCMLEDAQSIINGIKLIMKYLEIPKAVIGIGADKAKAIETLRNVLDSESDISVIRLRADYPNGAEKVIINNTVNRRVKSDETPADAGVMLLNVSTAAFISSYFETGMPLVSKRVTVSGDIVRTPCNLRAPIGTPIPELLAFAETNMSATEKIIIGGTMTGVCVTDADIPLTRECNGVLAFMKPLDDTKGQLKDTCLQTNCIRCGECMRACPVNLMPMKLEKAFDKKKTKELERLKAGLCIECGSCSYVCPAKRPLTEKIKLAKAELDGN